MINKRVNLELVLDEEWLAAHGELEDFALEAYIWELLYDWGAIKEAHVEVERREALPNLQVTDI